MEIMQLANTSRVFFCKYSLIQAVAYGHNGASKVLIFSVKDSFMCAFSLAMR